MKFTLSEEDAATHGVPREVEYDETRLTGREAIALKKLTGWTLERLADAGVGDPVLDSDGRQVWLRGADGNPVLDEAGQKIPLRSMDPEALLVMLWIAVRRAKGSDVPWHDFDIDLASLAEAVEPGKAPEE